MQPIRDNRIREDAQADISRDVFDDCSIKVDCRFCRIVDCRKATMKRHDCQRSIAVHTSMH